MVELQQQAAAEQAFIGSSARDHQREPQQAASTSNKLNSKPLQALSIMHNEQIRIESEAILSSAASTSHAVFGNFALRHSISSTSAGQPVMAQLALLRSLNTIELYGRVPGQEGRGLELICKYHMPNARCLDMKKLTIDARKSIFEPCSQIVEKTMREETSAGEGSATIGGFGGPVGEQDEEDYFDVRTKDILVVQMPELKFLLLEFDPAVSEFGTYCLFNLDHTEELQVTGKRFPKKGLLRTLQAESAAFSGFGFLADDTLFCWVQLQQIQEAAILQNLSAAQIHASQNGGGVLKQTSLQKAQSLELIKRQSTQMWADMRDPDEPQAHGVIPSTQLNEKYMNAMPGDPSRVLIEQLVKPLEFFQLSGYGIQYVVDIQLVESRTSQTISLLVLYKGDIDKMVGTKARYPVTCLAIFELQGAGLEPIVIEEPATKTQQQSSKTQQNGDLAAGQPGSALLKFVLKIEALPLYADRILTTASTLDDYCFLVTPYSLCLVRLESNRVTEIFTSTLGLTITKKFKEDPLKMFYPQQTDTERSTITEFTSQELMLDGTTRLVCLPDHRLLVLDQKGDFTMITIRFDQAEIDVAEAIFQRINASERLTASTLCWTPIFENVGQNGIDFDLFIASHFHDATLLRLKTVKDPDVIAQLEQSADEVEKRQRLNSDSAQKAFMGRRKRQMTYYEPLLQLEAIPTVSPICDASQIPSIAGVNLKDASQTQYSMDFLVASGNHVKSYLTFASASLPLMEKEMPLSQLLPASELNNGTDLRILRLISYLDKYIIVNYASGGQVKTSAIAIDTKTKKLVQQRQDKLNMCFDMETLAFSEISDDAMVQVCPKMVNVLSLPTPTETSQQLTGQTILEENKTIIQACIDAKTRTLFTLVRTGDLNGGAGSTTTIEASKGTDLSQVFSAELSKLTASVSAISITAVPSASSSNLLCATTDATTMRPAELFIFEIRSDTLALVFKCAQINEQLPLLPNQLRSEHLNLMSRCLTDLSVNISPTAAMAQQAASASYQIETHIPRVQEVKLWFPEAAPTRPILLLFLEDSQVLLYQSFHPFSEKWRFRFKLIDSHVLVKPKSYTGRHKLKHEEGIGREQIHVDGKIALILHPQKPFAVLMRHSRPICIDVGRQQGQGFASLVFFQTGFLAIETAQNCVKIVRFPARFDPRAPSVKLCDGYLLKQITFKDKGLKKIKIFSPMVETATGHVNPPGAEEQKGVDSGEQSREYIFLASYEHRRLSETAPGMRQGDFPAQARAPSINYAIEVLRMPRPEKWNEYSEEALLRNAIHEEFLDNQVINQLEQITLKSTQGDFRNYLAVASVRIDSTQQTRPRQQRHDDEGFYSSKLNIFQVVPDKNKLEHCLVESYKRSITCMSSYLGGFITTMKQPKLPDLVFIMYKFDETLRKLVDEQPLPNGVINLATSIAFDGDYIIIGDAYKNLHLLKKCDEQDNRQERQESSGLIYFKKVMSNKIDANVIGAFSLNKKLALRETDQARYCQNGVMSYEQIVPLTEIQKKRFTVIAASFDGYIRLYKINEVKNLEICAQVNVMDKVLSTVPLVLNQLKPREKAHEEEILANMQDRKIAIVTQRNGILIASPCNELEFRAQKSLIELASRMLPHRGCLTPMHSHLTPTTAFPEKSSVYERTNSNSINYGKSIYLFYFLSAAQKRSIASKIGFSVERLDQFICGQRQWTNSAPINAMNEQVSTAPVTKQVQESTQQV